MKFVDTHAHIFLKDAPMVQNALSYPTYDATTESYLNHLDQHKIQHGVLIQPSFLGYDNDYLLSAIQQYSDRLKGVVIVPFETPLDTLQSLKNQGIVGVRLICFGPSLPDFNSISWTLFLSHIKQLNWHIELLAPPAYLIKLLPELDKFQLQVVIDHFGRIDLDKGIDDPDYQLFLSLLDPDYHWIKMSAFYSLTKDIHDLSLPKQAYACFKESHMLSQLVWGSDWPHTMCEDKWTYADSLTAFHQIVTNEEERELILSDNALTLYGFAP